MSDAETPSNHERALRARHPAHFPRSGWRCVGVEDLRAPTETCDACGRRRLRHVHKLRHADWPAEIGCGCVCAGLLEGNPGEARRREKALRSFSGRRGGWLDAKGWRPLRSGGEAIERGEWRCFVHPRVGGWGAVARHLKRDFEVRSTNPFSDLDEARSAAFEAMAQAEIMGDHLDRPVRQPDLIPKD